MTLIKETKQFEESVQLNRSIERIVVCFLWQSGCVNDIEFLDEKLGNVLVGDRAVCFLSVVKLNSVCFSCGSTQKDSFFFLSALRTKT